MKTTCKERMRRLRARRKEDEEFDKEDHLEKERLRIAKLREKQKKLRQSDLTLHAEYKMKERIRKRKQREKKRLLTAVQMEGNPLILRMGNYAEGKIPGRKNRRFKNLQ